MDLLIISPEKTLFKGTVDMVEVPGTKGRFTILNNHAPIISSLVKGDIIYKQNNEETKVPVDSGLVEVNLNKITICIEKSNG